MPNDFYTSTGDPATRAFGASALIRAQFAAVQAAFDKLPTLTANAGKALVVAAGSASVGLTTGTFALAGNFATTGAFNTTLIQGATVSLTLPVVSGTLATLAGTETFTNKTLTSPTLVTPALGTPASGVLTNCTGTASGLTAGNASVAAAVAIGGVTGLGSNVATFLATPSSANLAAAVTGVTGSGSLVFATSPTLVTPNIGVATGTSVTLSSLTSGRIPLVSTGGLLNDSANITYMNTSTYRIVSIDGSASGECSYVISNSHASGGAVFVAASEGNGDQYIRLIADSTGAATTWCVGSDASASNLFAISIGINLNTTSNNKFAITRSGSVITNPTGSALTTTATDGFTYIPTCAGTPTGVPTAVTGAAPMVIDSTNNKLYFYSGGAWRDAGP